MTLQMDIRNNKQVVNNKLLNFKPLLYLIRIHNMTNKVTMAILQIKILDKLIIKFLIMTSS